MEICNYPDKICEYMTVLHRIAYCESIPCYLKDKSMEQLDVVCKEQKNKSSLIELLGNYYKFHGAKDLAVLFENYMQGIGARKLDRRRKDTANTYRIASGINWNWAECYYYKNSGDWQENKKFTFSIKFSKIPVSYLLIESGSYDVEIKRLYEIAFGTVLYYDRESLLKLVRQHPELFVMLCDEEK